MARLRNVSVGKFKELQNATKGNSVTKGANAKQAQIKATVEAFYRRHGEAMTTLAHE